MVLPWFTRDIIVIIYSLALCMKRNKNKKMQLETGANNGTAISIRLYGALTVRHQ